MVGIHLPTVAETLIPWEVLSLFQVLEIRRFMLYGRLTPTPSPITEMEIRAVQYQVIRLRLME